jgi:hypothetical protein
VQEHETWIKLKKNMKQALEAKDSQSGVKHIISNGWIK